MTVASTPVQERRTASRRPGSPALAIHLLRPDRDAVRADSVNFSERGLCLRVRESLEVRSLIRLQLTPVKTSPKLLRSLKPLQCTARVFWVVQRLDLRPNPPFVFDVGVELVDPSPLLRGLLAQRAGVSTTTERSVAAKKWVAPSLVRGQQYIPRLERSTQPGHRWRLVVSVEGIACFSEHYPSDQAAALGWTRFKRRLGKR